MRDTVLARPVSASVAAGVLLGQFRFAVPAGMKTDPLSLALNAFLAAAFAGSMCFSLQARRHPPG
jgi:hypothetical protein